MTLRRFLVFLCAAVLVPATAGLAHSEESWHFTAIDAPAAYGPFGGTQVYGISDNGLVTGSYGDSNGTFHGLVWEDGVLRTVDHPDQGPFGTSLFYGNNHQQVAGGYFDANGVGHAIVYDARKNRFERLPDVPGATFNSAGGISNSGRTAGNYTFDPNLAAGYVAWLYDGEYHDYVAPGSAQEIFGSATYAMNDHLSTAGYYFDSDFVAHGFVKPHHGPLVVVDVPGAQTTNLFGINDAGVLSGSCRINGVRHGFVMDGGQVTNVDFPGARATWVAGINNRGDVAGFYRDGSGFLHGFMARHD